MTILSKFHKLSHLYFLQKIISQYGEANALMILVGNKCDVSANRRRVSYEEGAALAKELNIPFFETSAKEV